MKKLTFKKGKGFLHETKFTHKGNKYFWGIDKTGVNHVFKYIDFTTVEKLNNYDYQQLLKELDIL